MRQKRCYILTGKKDSFSSAGLPLYFRPRSIQAISIKKFF